MYLEQVSVCFWLASYAFLVYRNLSQVSPVGIQGPKVSQTLPIYHGISILYIILLLGGGYKGFTTELKYPHIHQPRGTTALLFTGTAGGMWKLILLCCKTESYLVQCGKKSYHKVPQFCLSVWRLAGICSKEEQSSLCAYSVYVGV